MKHSRNNTKFFSPTEVVELTLLYKYTWGYTRLYRYRQKTRVSFGNPLSIAKRSQFACTRAELKLHLLHVSLQGELKPEAEPRGDGASEGGVQTQSLRWERRRLCCIHMPTSHLNTKHSLDRPVLHGGRCCPWLICFSISQHLWGCEEHSQAYFGRVGILAQNPSWPDIDHFRLVSADSPEQTWSGFMCTFFKDKPMALGALVWQTRRGYSTTLNRQNHTSSFPTVLGDAPPACLHSHLESRSWSCTNSCCGRLHVSMSPCFTVML